MKRSLCMLLIALLLLPCAVAEQAVAPPDASVDAARAAVGVLKAWWTDYYSDPENGDRFEDHSGWLQIVNTRVITVREDPRLSNGKALFEELPQFQGLRRIVEFMLISDYYGAEPVYGDCGISDCVMLYDDGRAEVRNNVLALIGGRYYSYDFTGIVEGCDDLGDAFNATWRLLKPDSAADVAEPSDDGDAVRRARSAVSALEAGWRKTYSDGVFQDAPDFEGYLEIKHARVYTLRDELRRADGRPVDFVPLMGIKYLVEFELYDEYLLSRPIPMQSHMGGFVAISAYGVPHWMNGSSPLALYSSRYFEYDLSGIVEDIVDVGDDCNQVFRLAKSSNLTGLITGLAGLLAGEGR